MPGSIAVYIPSYNRPQCITVKALHKAGYTGDYFIVIGDDEPRREEYEANYPGHILKFNKTERIAAGVDDTLDNFKLRSTPVYGRNACNEFALKAGYKYYVQMDDDLITFVHNFACNRKLAATPVKQLDKVFSCITEFLECSEALISISFANTRENRFGLQSSLVPKGLVKGGAAVFVEKTRSLLAPFRGTVFDDDVTINTALKTGKLCFIFPAIAFNTKVTIRNSGGTQGAYATLGEYYAFYPKLSEPAPVKLRVNTLNEGGFNLRVNTPPGTASPQIISGRYKKNGNTTK